MAFWGIARSWSGSDALDLIWRDQILPDKSATIRGRRENKCLQGPVAITTMAITVSISLGAGRSHLNVRYCLFLSLGLTRVYPAKWRNPRPTHYYKLLEPDGSRVCRRNILALAVVVVVAGFAGADPIELSVFGVDLSGDRGVLVLGVAVISAHIYWYVQRYLHLNEDGMIEMKPPGEPKRNVNIRGHEFHLEQSSANLISNYVAFVLTVLSWWFVVAWIFSGRP